MLWHKLPPPFWVAEIEDFGNGNMEGVNIMVICYGYNSSKTRKVSENKRNTQINYKKS